MTTETMSDLHVRVPAKDKEIASNKAKTMGMDLSTAVNIFLKQFILQNEFPIKICSIPQVVLNDLDEAHTQYIDGAGFSLDELKNKLHQRRNRVK